MCAHTHFHVSPVPPVACTWLEGCRRELNMIACGPRAQAPTSKHCPSSTRTTRHWNRSVWKAAVSSRTHVSLHSHIHSDSRSSRLTHLKRVELSGSGPPWVTASIHKLASSQNELQSPSLTKMQEKWVCLRTYITPLSMFLYSNSKEPSKREQLFIRCCRISVNVKKVTVDWYVIKLVFVFYQAEERI